jgi:DNA polymerase-3 subunit chi
MPKIDFYLLSQADSLNFACRLIEKIYKQRHRIYIHTASEKEAHALDEALWTFRDDSFLPHNLYGEGPDPAPPIQIGFKLETLNARDVLLNLSPAIPEFYTQFNRVLELIQNEPNLQEKARERYRYYRTLGHPLTTHKL